MSSLSYVLQPSLVAGRQTFRCLSPVRECVELIWSIHRWLLGCVADFERTALCWIHFHPYQISSRRRRTVPVIIKTITNVEFPLRRLHLQTLNASCPTVMTETIQQKLSLRRIAFVLITSPNYILNLYYTARHFRGELKAALKTVFII